MRIGGLWRTGPYSPLLLFLLHSLLPLIRPSNAGNQNIPRLQLSHTELRSRTSSAVFWDGGEGGAYQALLLDEDRGWLLVGGRDHIYMLNSDSFTQPARKVSAHNYHHLTAHDVTYRSRG
ncbi:semaphorin-3D-like [Sinocyclocheilus grahami]|uniref:semaphorin-3D-like n=1 Tax=Sinocyclocheilus grahami TaxID=75366 RepID=UPI0007ACD66D|nr:PREDICTED: semaphorin-3D-like [Sinocyclocheilus grahami]